MNKTIEKLILSQGYTADDIKKYNKINLLIRWTPFVCALAGIIGMLAKSSIYFFILGCFTFIGAFSKTSFFDYIYKFSIQFFLKENIIPPHGNARRFGCGIGAIMYLLSGFGFYIHNYYLAFIPGILIVVLAIIAALTQWCFASTLYNFLFKKKEKCCV